MRRPELTPAHESSARHDQAGPTTLKRIGASRLRGVRRELADGATTVASVAYAWGYVNLGSFAAAYRRRFGEYPSQTLRGIPHM